MFGDKKPEPTAGLGRDLSLPLRRQSVKRWRLSADHGKTPGVQDVTLFHNPCHPQSFTCQKTREPPPKHGFGNRLTD